MRRCRLVRACGVALAAALAVAACGKKGPPLAPLRLVPAAPAPLTAVRMASEVSLRFTVPPARAASAPDPVDIDRIEIYAVSLAAGVPAPPNREFLTEKYRVASVAVRPAPVAGEQPAAGEPAATESRPGPGEEAQFVEQLTAEMLAPVRPSTPPPPVVVVTRGQVPSIPVVADVLSPKHPVRIYAARAVTRRGVMGNPSTRVQVPLVAPPPAVGAVTAAHTETAITLAWTAPETAPGASLLYNIYKADAPSGPPLTSSPVAAPRFERPGVEFGVEQCFVVRSVTVVGGVSIESGPSAPACITPRDTFPPSAPVGLSAVSSGGVVALIWDPNTEADLAGYLVLRAAAPGDTLRPVTATPITDTAYRDTSVTPGVRYVYAIVAVDRTTPPNISAQSTRVEVTAAQ